MVLFLLVVAKNLFSMVIVERRGQLSRSTIMEKHGLRLDIYLRHLSCKEMIFSLLKNSAMVTPILVSVLFLILSCLSQSDDGVTWMADRLA